MNAKLVVALILTLQVSSSLCEVPEPSAELVQTYNQLREKFITRLKNLVSSASSSPVVQTGGGIEEGKVAVGYLNQAVEGEEFKSIAKVAAALVQEMDGQVQTVRNGALGLYGKYIRPVAKDRVETFIKSMQEILDKVMPAN